MIIKLIKISFNPTFCFTDRRPLLLNSVLLRQNPHNVAEWLNRVELFKQKEKPHEIINTYTEAVQTVDPKQAVGKLHHLWVNFAKFYDENDQLEDARVILEKATHVAFLKVCITLKSIRF